MSFASAASLKFNLFPSAAEISFPSSSGNVLATGFFPKADANAAAAADKFDPACFERLLDRGEGTPAGLNRVAFDHIKGDNGKAGFRRQNGLRPFQESARGADLSGCDHGPTLAET